ncbi:MAG TPA: NAD(P)-dependent alcohol dehydrogenase [Pyrinomonadaceae bacterium]|nr:NAD(P)-dependent alcohol dehydrogenase [Pyrinomonadaceae bacterium]
MKAYRIRKFGIGELSLIDIDQPKPQAGEVLVRLRAASLNYRDLMMIEGTYNPRLRLPLVPFSDGAGEVAEIGEDVKRWKVGDRVCPIFMQGWVDGELDYAKSKTTLGGDLDGCLREYGVFNQESLVKIPDHLSFEEAACLPCAGVTAWNALMISGGLKAGDSVLVQGTGGVSIFALQFAKFAGAEVFVTSSSDEKLERARNLGADNTLNYRTQEAWDNWVLELTNKRGVDHVVEVGGAGTLQRSMRAVRMGGHIAVIGVVAGNGEYSHAPIFMKALRLIGVFVGSRTIFEDMNRAIEESGLKPAVDQIFEFEDVRSALEYMKSGSHFGKITIRI